MFNPTEYNILLVDIINKRFPRKIVYQPEVDSSGDGTQNVLRNIYTREGDEYAPLI